MGCNCKKGHTHAGNNSGGGWIVSYPDGTSETLDFASAQMAKARVPGATMTKAT